MEAPSTPTLTKDDVRRLFGRAADLLSASANYRQSLEQTLAACLPALGDFGFFDARDGGEVVRVSAAHEDPDTAAFLRRTRWMPQMRTDMNLCALSSGQPGLHPGIGDEWYRAAAANEAHLAGMRRLAFKSMITVPMRYRGEVIGALTLFMARSGRRHTEEHLELAAHIASLASPLIANAALVERRANAEAALAASESRIRLACEAAGLGMFDWTLATNEVYWSPEYRYIYGLDPEEPPRFDRGMAVVVPEDRSGVAAAVAASVDGLGEYRSLHRVNHPSKGLRWVQALGRPLVGANGTVERFTGVVMDVTERERAGEELGELRDRLSEELKTMRRLQALSARTVGNEDEFRLLLAEILETALEITGRERGVIQLYDADDDSLRFAAQRGFDDAFCRDFARVGRDDVAPSALALSTRTRIVVEDLARDTRIAGSAVARRLIEAGIRSVQSTPLMSRDGRVVGMFTTHAPLPTALDEREKRLLDLLARSAADLIDRSQAYAKLREADRRKDEFLAIMSHELRNPLAPIRLAVTIAGNPATTPEQRAHAQEVIERQVKHMGRLVDDLLDVSRIVRGEVALRRERFELRTAIDAAVEAANHLLDARGHELQVRVPKAIVVDADPVRITQMVTNLLTNAAKYTQSSGRIEIEAEADGTQLALSVLDNGVGIAPELRPRLFTLFSQADAGIDRAQGGLGVGLALVKGFARLHGGLVEAHSAGPGQGSRFVIRMPIVVDRAAARLPSQVRDITQN
jgi:PAS domain S-box-containing protein